MSQKLLTPAEQRFVTGFVATGSVEQAGLIAGWSPKSARVSGWRAQRRPHVAAAIREALNERLGALTPKALNRIEWLMENGERHADQLKAAIWISERFYGPLAVQHTHEHRLSAGDLTLDQAAARMQELAALIGPALARARDPMSRDIPQISATFSELATSGATPGPQITPLSAPPAATEARHHAPEGHDDD